MKYTKGILLGLLVVLCMSVAVAADVSEDTTSDVEIQSLADNSETSYDDVDEVSQVDTVKEDVVRSAPHVQTTYTVNVTPSTTSVLTNITNDTTYDFSGAFTLGDLNYENLDTVVFTSSQKNAIFYNTTITLNGEYIEVSNIEFDNLEKTGNPITINASTNAYVSDNNIKVVKNTAEETFAINVINSNTVTVADNFINETGVPQMMGWDTGVGAIKFSGIVFNDVDSSFITNNELYIQNCSVAYPFGYSTMEAITVKGGSHGDKVQQNNITITGSEYIYAISLSEFDNNIDVEDNNIYLNGSNYICGIQFSSVTNSAARRNVIKGNCTSTSGSGASYEAFAYGIAVLTGTYQAPASEATGNTLESNDVTLNSTVAYAYELSNADYTTISNNIATVYGNVVMALGIYNSSYNGITGNTFTVTGNTRTLNDSIYEAIPPETTGIKIVDDGFNNTKNNVISGNKIGVTDTNSTNIYTVIIGNIVYNTTVTHNRLTGTTTGDAAVLDYGDDSVISGNSR